MKMDIKKVIFLFLTQQSWIRALDNKFSLLKAQKIYYKALINYFNCSLFLIQ
jgi:hypothetical protein